MDVPEVGRGLIRGWGGKKRLAAMVSPTKSGEIIFLGTPVTVGEAYRLGLVKKVAPLAQEDG